MAIRRPLVPDGHGEERIRAVPQHGGGTLGRSEAVLRHLCGHGDGSAPGDEVSQPGVGVDRVRRRIGGEHEDQVAPRLAAASMAIMVCGILGIKPTTRSPACIPESFNDLARRATSS